MIFFRYFLVILVGAGFLSACEKNDETNIAEHQALCSEYGHVSKSPQFIKCVKRQNIIAKYENENWLMLILGFK